MTSVIGKERPALDGEQVTGAAVYAIDHEEPRPAAREAASAHRSRPGASSASTPHVRCPASKDVIGADAPRLAGFLMQDMPLLAQDVVRYVGEPVAAGAADTVAQARAAANAIELELEPLPAVTDVESALAPDAPLVHERWAEYEGAPPGRAPAGNIIWEASAHHGSFEAAFARDDVVVVEDEFESHRQHQAYIEPKACVVSYEAGRYVVHSATQWLRTRCARPSPTIWVCGRRTCAWLSRRSAEASAGSSTPAWRRSPRLPARLAGR